MGIALDSGKRGTSLGEEEGVVVVAVAARTRFSLTHFTSSLGLSWNSSGFSRSFCGSAFP